MPTAAGSSPRRAAASCSACNSCTVPTERQAFCCAARMPRDLVRFFAHAVCPARGRLRAWRVARGEVWQPGEGAGRWNREGDDILYATTTAALATLEALAHLEPADARRPHRIACFCVDLRAGDLACL